MADVNPWSAEGWNITAQMDYVRRFGVLRAEARARDAGTVLGGRRPAAAAQPYTLPPTAPFVSPKYIIINKIQQVAVAPPPSALFSQEEIHPLLGVDMFSTLTRELDMDPLSPAFGYAAAAVVTLELDLPGAAPSLGLTTATSVTLEKDFAAAMTGGLTMASAFQLSRELVDSNALGVGVSVVISLVNGLLSVSAALGFNTAASLDTTTLSLGLPSMSLGAAMVSAVTLERDVSAAASLGLAVAVSVNFETRFAASAALGFDTAATLTCQRNLPAASPALGATMAATMTTAGLTKSFVGTHIQNTNGLTHSWTASIGTATSDRFVIVAAAFGDPTHNIQLTGVTINGVAATQLTVPSQSPVTKAFYMANVPAGTTCTIVATITAAGGFSGGSILAAWTVTGNVSLALQTGTNPIANLDNSNATSSATRSLTTSTPGVAFAMACGFPGSNIAGTVTWTGVTGVDTDVNTNLATASNDMACDYASINGSGSTLSVHFSTSYSSSGALLFGEAISLA